MPTKYNLMSLDASLMNIWSQNTELSPKSSQLFQWEIGNLIPIADAKAYHMTKDGLDLIMREFLCSRDGFREWLSSAGQNRKWQGASCSIYR